MWVWAHSLRTAPCYELLCEGQFTAIAVKQKGEAIDSSYALCRVIRSSMRASGSENKAGVSGLPTKHRCGTTEIAHANKGNDGANQREPLQALCSVGVASKANVTGKADQPHCGAAPKTYHQPAHGRFTMKSGYSWCVRSSSNRGVVLLAVLYATMSHKAATADQSR